MIDQWDSSANRNSCRESIKFRNASCFLSQIKRQFSKVGNHEIQKKNFKYIFDDHFRSICLLLQIYEKF